MATSSRQAKTDIGPFMRVSKQGGFKLRERAQRLQEYARLWLRTPATVPWHVFLPPDYPEASRVDWRGPDGQIGSGPLTALPELARRSPIRVWTPAIETLLTIAQWPGRGRGRLVQALPFLLEDQLVMEPELLAFSHKETDAGIVVAVTAKDRLAAWRSELDREKLNAALCPVTLALPWRSGTWSCRFADGQWAVRTGLYSGFGAAGHLRQPPAALQQALAEAKQKGALPETLTLFGGDEGLRQMLTQHLGLPVVADQGLIGEGEMPFRLGDTGGSGVGASGLTAVRALRPTFIVLALWLFLGFAYTVFEWVTLAHQESRVQSQMVSLFTTNFPNAPVLDPARQMRQGVEKLSAQAGGGGGFLTIMTLAAPALSGLSAGALTRLSYRHGRVRCAIRVADFAALTALKRGLQRGGLQVTVTHIISHHGGVSAHVVLSRRSL